MATKSTEERVTRNVAWLAVRLDGLIDTLTEASKTALDATSEHYRTECNPDGDWVRISTRATERIWRRQTDDELEELVVLESASIGGEWRIYHCPPDGTINEHTAQTHPREAAFEAAERLMGNRSRVPARRRTGRTAVADPTERFESDLETRGIDIPVEAE